MTGLGPTRCFLGQIGLGNKWLIRKMGWAGPILQFGGGPGRAARFDNSRYKAMTKKMETSLGTGHAADADSLIS